MMKRIERAAIGIVSLMIVLRLILGTNVNVVLMVSLVLLAIYYLWFGVLLFNNVEFHQLFSKYKNPKFNVFKISSSIIMGLIYSFSTLSVMFALYFYSNMNFMLGFAFVLIFLSVVFIVFFNRLKKAEKSYLYQFYIRSAAYGIICLFLLITPVEKRLEVLFRDHPEFVEAYKNHLENPDDPEAEEELRKQRNRFR